MASTDRLSWSLNNPDFTGWNFNENVMYRANLVWDTVGLTWVKQTSTGGGGGGGAVTIANGADTNAGSTTDVAVLGDTAGTVSAKLRGINKEIAATVGLGIAQFDSTALTPAATTDVWTFFTGGLAGTLVNTVTINYTDSTKATILNVVKT